jgi:hypothetical protein
MDSIREIKARHTGCLMRSYQEAMDGWRESKQDTESETVKSGKSGVETTTRRQGQCGNPAFLAEARAALADIRKIWGADEPVTIHHGGDMRYSGMPRDEARRQYAQHRIEQYQRFLDAGEN